MAAVAPLFSCKTKTIKSSTTGNSSVVPLLRMHTGCPIYQSRQILLPPRWYAEERIPLKLGICNQVFSVTRAVPGKIRAELQGRWDLFAFPYKHRSRRPIQANPEEIFISHYQPNGSRGSLDILFPSRAFVWKCLLARGFRSRSVKTRGNINSQISCTLKLSMRPIRMQSDQWIEKCDFR